MSWPSESDAPSGKQLTSPQFQGRYELQPCIGVTGSSVRSSVPVDCDLFSGWFVSFSNSGAQAANRNSQPMKIAEAMPTRSLRRRATACCQGLRATTPIWTANSPEAGTAVSRALASAVATHQLLRRMHAVPPCAADTTAGAVRMPPHEAHDRRRDDSARRTAIQAV